MVPLQPNGAIRKVCVIGAGTMGAGIAAQVANAGVPVLLLDILPRDGSDRDAVAKGAVAKMLKTDPAPFMSRAAPRLVETGNIDDHLARIVECDWVIEAIVERLDIKQSLYARIEAVKRPGTAVSSNTSTIPLGQLVEGRSDQFRRDFLITHFFNPPRYMRLLEIVAGAQSDADVVGKVADFADRALGKSIIRAHDTPGFVANRIGTYWLQVAVNAAIDMGLTVEEADQIGGKPMGVPKTGVFGLIDLVGLDLMPLLQKSLTSTLKPGDPYFDTVRESAMIAKMIETGHTGRKGKGGFYKLDRSGGKPVKQALDLATGAYRVSTRPAPLPRAAERDLAALVAVPGKVGDYAWHVLGHVLSYAAMVVPETADDIVAIDDAMRLGYNWRYGPFELIDRLGPGRFAERLAAEGRPVPAILKAAGSKPFYRVEDGRKQYLLADGTGYRDLPRADGVLLLEDVKRRAQPVAKNGSAALWDIGNGVLCLEFTAKMNALDGDVIALMSQSVGIVKQGYKALVIYNEGSNFSAGANLGLALFAINIAAYSEVEKLIAGGQQAIKALKYAPFPVVAAPAGMALGGGCEICLNADAVQAHAETYMGLVETGVGLIPGWGGNGEYLDRLATSGKLPRGPMPAAVKAFETISTATVSKSAAQARELMFLRDTDGITMNRDRLLADAKARALALVDGYAAPKPPEFRLAGESGRVGMAMAVRDFQKKGMATPYDAVVAATLADVLTGGPADIVDTVSEAQLLELERKGFLARVKDARTVARIEAMLTTGKPLRN